MDHNLALVPPFSSGTMECPLCLGKGELTRAEVLDRLGVKDFARVAQLSAEEAFRLLLSKQKQDEQSVWARFEAELAKRTADIAQRHKDDLHTLTARTKHLEAAARVAEHQKATRRNRDNSPGDGMCGYHAAKMALSRLKLS
jgi:hypothetical protein